MEGCGPEIKQNNEKVTVAISEETHKTGSSMDFDRNLENPIMILS